MATLDHRIKRLLSRGALGLIKLYQYLLSPWIGYHCRFHPSCSRYAKEAIQVHGLWKGSYLAGRRMLRCHPWHSGGIDLVPTNETQLKK